MSRARGASIYTDVVIAIRTIRICIRIHTHTHTRPPSLPSAPCYSKVNPKSLSTLKTGSSTPTTLPVMVSRV